MYAVVVTTIYDHWNRVLRSLHNRCNKRKWGFSNTSFPHIYWFLQLSTGRSERTEQADGDTIIVSKILFHLKQEHIYSKGWQT